jgi:hypothetical protein
VASPELPGNLTQRAIGLTKEGIRNIKVLLTVGSFAGFVDQVCSSGKTLAY